MKISDYGLIGNARTAALISKSGSIDWACFPKFDAPSHFGKLLGSEESGTFSITPSEKFDSIQEYVTDTNVLVTTFTNSSGRARISDCFSVSDESFKRERLLPDHEILRVLEGEQGEMSFKLKFQPARNYGQKPIRLKRMGAWGILAECGQEVLILQSSVPLDLFESGEFVLRAGKRAIFSLAYLDNAPGALPQMGDAALDRMNETIRYWRSWISRCKYGGRYADDVKRSALVLKLLTFAPSGAVVAAPTSSLPEWMGGERNWDYRFCWLRDASFTVEVLLALGYEEEAKAFANWLLHSTRLTWPRLQVVYSVYGNANLREKRLEWLAGFRDSRPVRIGNEASAQLQLDIYGEVIDALYRLLPQLEPLDGDTRKMLLGIGETVAKGWLSPDSGIWESRSWPRHYTHSKVMCWVALDRLARISKRLRWKGVEKFSGEAARIRQWIEGEAFSTRLGGYVQAAGYEALDASLLVMPLVGYGEVNSYRMKSTRDLIAQKLGRRGLIYRYPPASDGMRDPEGAFLVCSFWMAENFFIAGEIETGMNWIDNVLQHRNSLGLWSEEINPEDGEFLGNYPQAFTHIGLIHALQRLEKVDWKESAA